MKIYLVGGAVRDMALGLAVKERDWVVVGSTPGELLAEGFKQVGRDFPVFLHPKTKEEYALARKERKTGPGYTGFVCEFDPFVTLLDDLARRDLTINAIAMDEAGQWIDPYHGLRDIDRRILRHVSPAFVEDPVRVLRVARFAARFAHLGFQVADETRALIYSMSKQHELDALVPERVWREWETALTARHPEVFIRVLRQTGALSSILPEIASAFGIPRLRLTPAMIVDVGESTLERLYAFSQKCSDPLLRFAVFCLELGKVSTNSKYWPFHPNEEREGVVTLSHLSRRLKLPNTYYTLAELGITWYHEIVRLLDLTPEAILHVLNRIDAWRRPERFEQVLQVIEAYHLNPLLTKRWQDIRQCAAGFPPSLMTQHQGEALKQAITTWRLACIQQQLNQWEQDEK